MQAPHHLARLCKVTFEHFAAWPDEHADVAGAVLHNLTDWPALRLHGVSPCAIIAPMRASPAMTEAVAKCVEENASRRLMRIPFPQC